MIAAGVPVRGQRLADDLRPRPDDVARRPRSSCCRWSSLTGYVGQISLAQMSLAGVAAFFMARMMADGSTTSTNPFPVDGPGLPWPIAGDARGGRGRRRRRAARAAGGAHPRRAAGRRHAGLRHLAADAVPGEPVAHRPQRRRAGQRPTGDVLRDRPGVERVAGSSTGRRSPSSSSSCSILCAFGVANLRRNGTGRRFLAVRANERAAAAAGVNVSRTKLLAFAIAAGIAGIGGVMLGVQAERRLVGQLRLPVEHRVPGLRLPRRRSRRSTAPSSAACWRRPG